MKKRVIAIIILSVFILFVLLFRRKEISTIEIIRSAYLGEEVAFCSFTDPGTEENFEVYISLNKIKPSFEKEMTFKTDYFLFENKNLIVQESTVYVWNEEKGEKYQIATFELEKFFPGIMDLDNESNFEVIKNNYQIECEIVTDKEIKIPDNIEFEEYQEEEEEEYIYIDNEEERHGVGRTDPVERDIYEGLDEKEKFFQKRIDQFYEERGDDYDLEEYWDFLEKLEEEYYEDLYKDYEPEETEWEDYDFERR